MKNCRVSVALLVIAMFFSFIVSYMLFSDSSDKNTGVSISVEPKKQAMSMHGISASAEGGAPILTLSKNAQKLAEIEVSPVLRQEVVISTPLYGTVDYDETRLTKIAAWMGGRIDALYVDYLGSQVNQGDAIALIYSPELITAQSELIQARRVLSKLNQSALEYIKRSSNLTEFAAYKKLQLLGISDSQIEEIIERAKPLDHLTIHAPIGGTVIQLNIREGMYVETGKDLYAIADLSHLWIICDAYEADLVWIKLGHEITFNIEAFPGKSFQAVVSYIDPFINQQTRTARVRLDLANPHGLLKPGMFIQASQKTNVKDIDGRLPLIIPASAPLITGTRAVVYVESPMLKGQFEGRVIQLGSKAGNYYIVKSGLKEGEKVVTNGNFKIDSEMQIKAKPSMMNPANKKNVIEETLPISYVK